MLNLDLSVLDSCSLKKMIIADDSFYDNVRIYNPNMEVTAPGYNKINVPFTPNEANVYNSVSFGISCGELVNLPDGLYTFKYSIQPNSNRFVEKTFLRTTLLECKYGKVLLSLLDSDCDCMTDKSKQNSIRKIRELIEGAIAASNDCDSELAYKLYDKANSMLDKINKCSC